MGINDSDVSGIPAAVAAVTNADATILIVGYSNALIEREGADHTFTGLPATQEVLVRGVLAAARGPVVLVLVNAGAIALEPELQPAAVVEAFYPAFGAPAIVRQLFGLTNRWGRLPYTMYESAFANRFALSDASVSGAPGPAKRTYRFYDGSPLWRFGDGGSYSTFAPLDCEPTSALTFPTDAPFAVTLSCVSTLAAASTSGDDVLLVFHATGADVASAVASAHPIPFQTLRHFDRISLAAGGAASPPVAFTLSPRDFSLTNATGASVLYPGTHTITVSGFNDRVVSFNVTLTGSAFAVAVPPPLPPSRQR